MLLMAVKLQSSFLTPATAYHSLTSCSSELHELTAQYLRCGALSFFFSFNLYYICLTINLME